jgi:hypothetical protein
MAPTSVFTNINTNRTMFEMLANANEMAQRIAGDLRDWTMMRTSVTFTGDGVTTAFNLPANYRRMLKTSHVWRSSDTIQPMRFFPDTDEWMQRRAANDTNSGGEWTIYGGQIHIIPVMGVDQTARFTYLDRNPVALASGGFGERFMDDADSFRLDERALKLGMVFNWKQLKGSPYAEDMGTYSDCMANLMGPDSPAPILIDRQALSANVRVASGWPSSWGMP